MASKTDGKLIRKTLLEVIYEKAKMGPGYFQSNSILSDTSRRLDIRGAELEQALLTIWYDLFRTGQLSWGYNLANPDPPFCHLTNQGRKTLENLSRDPSNPDGYLAHLSELGPLNPIANSYIKEALKTFNSDCYKSSAVMVGASAESMILELRDALLRRLNSIGATIPRDLRDWKLKRILDALKSEFDRQKSNIPKELFEELESYWPAFTQQIRSTRNEAGHPQSIEPITQETVHASLLIFQELVKLVSNLTSWILSDIN